MSTTARSRLAGAPASVVAALVLLALGALTGCSAGQVTQTSSEVSGVNGASGQLGPIAVRNATIAFTGPATSAAVYRVGGSAPLRMVIVNQGTQDDVLLSVSSPIAASGLISGDARLPNGQTLTLTGGLPALPAPPSLSRAPSSGSVQPSASASASASSPASASSTASASSPASASAQPSTSAQITLPTAPTVDPVLGTSYLQVALLGLRQDVFSGLSYPVVLTFLRAGQLQMELPVGDTAEPARSAE